MYRNLPISLGLGAGDVDVTSWLTAIVRGARCLAERRSHANRHGVEMPGRARDRASALPRMATEDAEDSGDTMAWRLGGCRGARACGAGRAPSWSEELWLKRVALSDVVSARSWPPGSRCVRRARLLKQYEPTTISRVGG
jgi:hypothetical protein